MMKRILVVLGVLLLTAAFAAADPLGISVGADLGFGDVLTDNYKFAGKADPPLAVPAGLGSIRPFIMYTKPLGSFTLFTSLENKFGLDDPETNDFKFVLSGTYDLFFNDKRSNFSFSADNSFRFKIYDGSIKVEDGAGGWSDLLIPAVKYTHTLNFGSIYGKFTLPISFTDPAVAEQAGKYGLVNNPEDYKPPFFFVIPEIGMNTDLGIAFYISSNIQISPDRKTTDFAPGYEKYASDIPIQQINLGIGYRISKVASSVIFEFPVPGDKKYTNGIKDQGFAITPALNFFLRDYLRLMVSCEFTNIGKDTGNSDADRVTVGPVVSLTFSF